eukprot:scaffold226662_cov29-Tisochrysis_lutea.AAC.4
MAPNEGPGWAVRSKYYYKQTTRPQSSSVNSQAHRQPSPTPNQGNTLDSQSCIRHQVFEQQICVATND